MRKLATHDSRIKYLELRQNLYYSKFKYKFEFDVAATLPERDNPVHNWAKQRVRYYEWRKSMQTHITNGTLSIRKEGGKISVFTNQLEVVELIKPYNIEYDIVECHASPDPEIKYFAQEPKYAFRVHLKSRSWTTEEKKDFVTFMDKNAEYYKYSNSMRHWAKYSRFRNHLWTTKAYYIDVTDDSMLSYLLVMFSELFTNIYKLEKRPDIETQ